ncbi:MAG: galactokinase [Oscillospiraceae bacterium]
MQKLGAVRRALDAGELDIVLSRLKYGGNGRDKVANVLEGFARSFGVDEERPVVLCSAPGRTEICGNHTDHQRGRVLAGAVDLDFLACASPNGTDRIRFQSEGWPLVEIGLDELLPKADERETTAALVRGMAGLVAERGYKVAGFDAYAVSEVLPGSGLSSSAACEVLLGVIENCLFCGGELDAVTIAQLGQRAENVYFGKPSGLMDQMASSVGGAVAIDFADPLKPEVRSVSVDLEAMGYAHTNRLHRPARRLRVLRLHAPEWARYQRVWQT